MKLPRRKFLHLVAGAAALSAVSTAPAAGQGPSLAGKNVQMIIGVGPGGYDLWGRTVARHIGKHLPGRPTVVPQNMPGAGSLNAANHIYNVAPKDGTAMGIIASAAVLGPITGASGARFDSTRFSGLEQRAQIRTFALPITLSR